MKKLFILLITTVCYSATNDTTIDSAIIKRIYMGNYNYNTILASAPILTMRWASDLNRPVFKNRTGTAYKMLADASTSSNTPSTRLFYADANGAAGSSANLTFDGTRLNIVGKLTISDSINSGPIKSSGRITGTDIDLGDSVIAVSGKFSGRVTGTDIGVSDSVIGVTGAFSGSLTGTTVNTGQGANELYAMDQNERTIDTVTKASLNVTRFAAYGVDAPAYIRIGKSVSEQALLNYTPYSYYLITNQSASQDGEILSLYSNRRSYTDDLLFRIKGISNYTTPDTGKMYFDMSGIDGLTIGKSIPSDRLGGGFPDGLDVVGNGAFTGRITATDFQASDSVIAVTGYYSGRVTGYTFDAFDSIKGTHGYFTWGLSTDGDVTAGADIYARDGKYTNRLTAQDLQASDSVIAGTIKSNIKIVADTIRSIGNSSEKIMLSSDPDYGYGIKIQSNQLRVSTEVLTPKLSLGTVGIVPQSFYLGSGGLTLGKIGTAPHDEQVIIKNLAPDSSLIIDDDSVSVRKLSVRTNVSTDSLKLGTGSYLKTYLDTTFYDTLMDAGSVYKNRVLARIVQIGKVVTLYQPQMYGTDIVLYATLNGIPSKFLPAGKIKVVCNTRKNSTAYLGCIEFNSGYGDVEVVLSSTPHVYTVINGTNSSGIDLCCISWIIP